MFDLILFSSIGLLLLVLVGFLVIVIRDHMKSKSFELYVHQSQEELKREAHRSKAEKENREHRHERKIVRPEPASRPQPAEEKSGGPAPVSEEKPAPSPATEKEEKSDHGTKSPQTVYQLHPESKPEISESQKLAGEILQKDYGVFSHQRLVEGMGLSQEEADEFVVELIHQLEDAINELDLAIERKDFDEVEHITHGLKGAALNIGEGGVADLLIEYNTYMKDGVDIPVIEAYQTLLKQTVSDLKVEYSQVA